MMALSVEQIDMSMLMKAKTPALLAYKTFLDPPQRSPFRLMDRVSIWTEVPFDHDFQGQSNTLLYPWAELQNSALYNSNRIH